MLESCKCWLASMHTPEEGYNKNVTLCHLLSLEMNFLVYLCSDLQFWALSLKDMRWNTINVAQIKLTSEWKYYVVRKYILKVILGTTVSFIRLCPCWLMAVEYGVFAPLQFQLFFFYLTAVGVHWSVKLWATFKKT